MEMREKLLKILQFCNFAFFFLNDKKCQDLTFLQDRATVLFNYFLRGIVQIVQ